VVLEDNVVLHIVGGGYGIYNTRQCSLHLLTHLLLLLLLLLLQGCRVCGQ
jgi:hypothetical protein